jgi:hypothetical protein
VSTLKVKSRQTEEAGTYEVEVTARGVVLSRYRVSRNDSQTGKWRVWRVDEHHSRGRTLHWARTKAAALTWIADFEGAA